MVGQLVGILVSFLSRLVFVRMLSAEYLGLNGLFTNILTLLSIAELGIGAAMVFGMYEPLALRDTVRIRALMGVFRRAYHWIGISVGVVGGLLTVFLPTLVKELPSIPHIEVIYLLFVADSALTYFFSYKRALLIADQKRYIATVYRYGYFTALNLVQIIILLATRNYLLFLVAQVVFTLLENIAVSRRVDRMYPFLSQKPVPLLEGTDRDILTKNLKAMVFHRLGSAVFVGTDSIIMAKFVSVVAVGLYSNYVLITNALNVVLGVIFSSLTASVGNLGVAAKVTRQVETFKTIDLAVFWAHGLASVSLFILFNPFITVWLGPEYLFEWPAVLAISLNFYITGVRNSIWIFKEAKGLFWQDRYRPVVEVFVNLVGSILLAQHFGVTGVLLGTVLTAVFVSLPWEPIVLFKYGFYQSPLAYYRQYSVRVLLTVGVGAMTWAAVNATNTNGWIGFFVSAVACLLIPNLVFYVAFGRTDEFKRLVSSVKRSR